FRSASAGLAVVLAVPLLVEPVVEWVTRGTQVRTAAGFPQRLREVLPLRWPFGGARYLEGALRMIGPPVGGALTLSVMALACAFLLSTRRRRVRCRLRMSLLLRPCAQLPVESPFLSDKASIATG